MRLMVKESLGEHLQSSSQRVATMTFDFAIDSVRPTSLAHIEEENYQQADRVKKLMESFQCST